MLLLPEKIIWRHQILFIAIFTTSLTIMGLIVTLQTLIQDYDRESFFGPTSSSEARDFLNTIEIYNPLFIIISSLIFMIGLLLLIESLFFWIPSLTDIPVFGRNGKMIWTKKFIGFPERVLSLQDTDTRIVIRRKRSSLRGLLLREFTMEVYIPLDRPEFKQISDFTSMEKINTTPTHKVLVKTVKFKYLPLQIIQIKSILALMLKSQFDTFSNV
ncbi:MAG: hypothetical protein ACFE9A_12130 [Candidatus Hodarchaeota archaeon]